MIKSIIPPRHLHRVRNLLIGCLTLTAAVWATPALRAELPSGWQAADIGSSNPKGRAEFADGAFTLTSAGQGFNHRRGDSDAGMFVYQEYTGDFEIVARLVDAGGGGAGLMARESLAEDARNEMVCFDTAKDQLRTDGRTGPYFPGEPVAFPNGVKTPPFWVKLVRCGDEIAMYLLNESPATPMRLKDQRCISKLAPKLCVGVFVSGGAKGAATARFTNVALNPAHLDYATSWIGNSLAGSHRSVQQKISSIFVEPVRGQIYTLGGSDEGHKCAQIFDLAGNSLGIAENSNQRRRSPYAVAATPDYVFWTGKAGGKSKKAEDYAVFRTTSTGQTAPIPNPDSGSDVRIINHQGHVRGLAADAGAKRLYVSDTPNNQILIFDLNLAPIGAFPALRPGSLALAKNGVLWCVQLAAKNEPAKLVRFANDGKKIGEDIAGLDDPRGIAVAPDGKVWVADHGVHASQFLIFSPEGKAAGTFGARGGILSKFDGTQPGEVHPLKFNGPMAVGFDSDGNVYTASNPELGSDLNDNGVNFSTELRKFDSKGNLLWAHYGLDWMDVGDADPKPIAGNFDFFTDAHRYSIDLAKPTGREWDYRAFTIDQVTSPEDPRIFAPTTGTYVRWIGGERFLFVTQGNKGGAIIVYRFLAGSASARPCFMLRAKNDKTEGRGPAAAPKSASWQWRDNNGDGRFDKTEFSPLAETSTQQWFVDAKGGLWCAIRPGTIMHYTCLGIEKGVPRYDDGVTFRAPSPFVECNRVVYDAVGDTLYLGGYTRENPSEGDDWKQLGREILRFDHWLARTNTTPTCRTVLPYSPKIQGVSVQHESYLPQGFAVAGDYLFAVLSATAEVLVYDARTGRWVDRIVAGPEVGGRTGLVDITHGITVRAGSDGEYQIFVEENSQCRVMMYRWRPAKSQTFAVTKQSGENNLRLAAKGASVEWAGVDGGTGCNRLWFRYANGSKEAAICELTVNGNSLGAVRFPRTGDWGLNASVDFVCDLGTGTTNSVRLTSTGESAVQLQELNVSTR